MGEIQLGQYSCKKKRKKRNVVLYDKKSSSWWFSARVHFFKVNCGVCPVLALYCPVIQPAEIWCMVMCSACTACCTVKTLMKDHPDENAMYPSFKSTFAETFFFLYHVNVPLYCYIQNFELFCCFFYFWFDDLRKLCCDKEGSLMCDIKQCLFILRWPFAATLM